MNKKNNKQFQFSIDLMEKAFLELLKEKNYHKITINDICNKAGVHRSTFYAHYKDIYDLAEIIEKDLADEIYRTFQQVEANSDDPEVSYLFLAFENYFSHIQKNIDFYRVYMNGNFPNSSIYRFIKEACPTNTQKSINEPRIAQHVAFLSGGIDNLIKHWINHDCKETPKELAIVLKEELGRSEIFPEIYKIDLN